MVESDQKRREIMVETFITVLVAVTIIGLVGGSIFKLIAAMMGYDYD